MPKIPDSVNLPAVFANKLATLRIDISFGVRAPIINGSPTLIGIWKADLYERLSGEKSKFLGTFVSDSTEKETPADLLRQLAEIYEAGEIRISK